MRLWIALAFLLALPAASAAPIDRYALGFDLAADGTALEHLSLSFAEPLASAQRSSITATDMSAVAVLADGRPLPVNLTPIASGVRLSFIAPAGTRSLNVSFRTAGAVFTSGETFQFFTNLQPPADARDITVTVRLPAGYAVHRGILSPAGAAVSSDGTRILASWSFPDPSGALPISLQYRRALPDYGPLAAGLGLLILVAAAAAWLLSHRRMERLFLSTFLEDERAVLLAVREARVAYQNKLERRFGFSRAKMTRIVQKLERHGLVRKERAGRTNRLTWAGPLFHTVPFARFKRETDKKPSAGRESHRARPIRTEVNP